jgi:hypothetical protein
VFAYIAEKSLRMKTFPLQQALVIVALIAANICILSILPSFGDNKKGSGEGNIELKEDVKKGKTIEVEPEFRFSSQPESVTLKTLDNSVIFYCDSFESENEHSQFPGINLPVDDKDVSRIQLIVKWKSKPSPYHFFTMEFYGHERGKFGTGVSGDIHQDLTLEW